MKLLLSIVIGAVAISFVDGPPAVQMAVGAIVCSVTFIVWAMVTGADE